MKNARGRFALYYCVAFGIVGSFRLVKLNPKKLSARERIKNAKKAIINPIIAAVMVCLALSTFALSPADMIQRTPPQIRKNKAIKAAATRIKAIAAPTRGPILFALRLHKLLN